MTEIRQAVIDNLKTICKLRNIKNVQIAEYMGVSQGSVTNWFKGTNAIDIDNLYKLCKYLNVSLDQIFGVKPLLPEMSLSDEESRLILAWRVSDEDIRKSVRKLLDIPDNIKSTEQSAI